MTDATANSVNRPDRLRSALALLGTIFLIGFALDAVLSTADELLRVLQFGTLLPIRNFLAGLIVLSAFLMGAALIAFPQLPKRILLAPILFALWCAFGALPYSVSYAGRGLSAELALAQLALAVLAFATIRFRTGRWHLTADDIPEKNRLAIRIAGNVAVTLVGFALIFVVLVVTTIGAEVERGTGGYIRFGLTAIEAKETTLAKGASTVRLVAMVHIAEPQFYQSLIDGLPPHSLVLTEGVTDAAKRLSGGLSYGSAARALGLQQQPSLARALALKHVDEENNPAQAEALPTIENADVDISTFSPTTLRFLRKVSELYRSRDFAETVAQFGRIQRTFTSRDLVVVFADILTNRNRHLLAAFNADKGSHAYVVIPWGGEHMPFMEASLLARGYRERSQDVRRVAGYSTMLSALFRRADHGQSPSERPGTSK